MIIEVDATFLIMLVAIFIGLILGSYLIDIIQRLERLEMILKALNLNDFERRMSKVDEELDKLEIEIEKINEKIDNEIENLNSALRDEIVNIDNKIDEEIDKLSTEIDRINDDIERLENLVRED